MSSSEILDSELDFSKETPQCDSKKDDGNSSSGECDKKDDGNSSSGECDKKDDGNSSSGECDKKDDGNSSSGECDKKDDGNSSSGECDSPGEIVSSNEQEQEHPEETVSKKENCTLLRPMDGELDYEEYDDKEKAKRDDAESDRKENEELDDDDEDQKKEKLSSEKEPNEEGEMDDDEKEEKKDGEKEGSIEEGEDEGEISDDDLEEGEVKDASPKPETTRQICRFYGRGQCFYGNACRFLHLTHNEKGQYNMFGPRFSPGYGYGPANMMGPVMGDRPGPRGGGDFMGTPPVPVPLQVEPSPVESAWERGLREAKELVKKANKRKEEEPDFDKKKLNLSINVNEKNTPDYDKENEYFFSRTYSKRNEGHYKKTNSRYDEPLDTYDNDRTAREHFRGGRYENFEIRYTREDLQRDRRGRDRSRGRMSSERERYPPKEGRNKDRLKDDRGFDIQMRTRAFEYVDPWRRSKTPKARRSRSRSGSYSSVSSYSYSERSSRSSCSYSRSSSRSSGASSRSPSVMHKRKPSPSADVGGSPKGGVGRFPLIKKKAASRLATARSSSSRSRSASRTPSASRSRSYSRSISMDSVSSASSSVSHSSSASESRRNRNNHPSILRKNDEKLPLDKLDSRNLSSAAYERGEDGERDQSVREDLYPSEGPAEAPPAFPSFSHLLPANDSKSKSQHKQQIKLTLLNKPSSSKVTSFPKKELDRSKLIVDQKSEPSKQDTIGHQSGTKRPLSPTLSAVNPKPNTAAPKKSASSRRDELLKQLKAVEDAIARKRAKFC